MIDNWGYFYLFKCDRCKKIVWHEAQGRNMDNDFIYEKSKGGRHLHFCSEYCCYKHRGQMAGQGRRRKLKSLSKESFDTQAIVLEREMRYMGMSDRVMHEIVNDWLNDLYDDETTSTDGGVYFKLFMILNTGDIRCLPGYSADRLLESIYDYGTP